MPYRLTVIERHGESEDHGAPAEGFDPSSAAGDGQGHHRNPPRRARVAERAGSGAAPARAARQGEVQRRSRGVAPRRPVIAVDTSAMVAYLSGDRGADLKPLDEGLG